MGAGQSNDNRRYQRTPPPQMSQDQVTRLLDAQRQQYERKLEEVAAKAAAQKKQEDAANAAQKKRQEDAARAAAQRKQQEEAAARAAAQRKQQEEDAARAAAQRRQQEEAARNSTYNNMSPNQNNTGLFSHCIERDRAPYSYSVNQLQQLAASAPPPPRPLFNTVYPNLGPLSPNNGLYMYNNNNPFRPTSPNQDFVFVNNNGQTASYNRAAPSAPSPPRGPSPRTRSVSRNRNSPRERDVLDCPTCHSRYGMKIFQCESGHSSCNDCKIRGRACGICKRSLTNLRNYDVENHVAQTKAPCPHTNEGCKLFIKIADMEHHVKECPFKEQDCPLTAVFGTCRWKGKLNQILRHFEDVHPNGCQSNVDSEMQLTNVRNNSQQVNLIVLGAYNFLVHVKVSENDGKVYMAVQLIGTKFSATKWLYEIHVYNKSESRRKYMYTDNCCASIDKIEDVFKAGECAVLPIWHANTFFCNGALNYKIFIKQNKEEKKSYSKPLRGKGDIHLICGVRQGCLHRVLEWFPGRDKNVLMIRDSGTLFGKVGMMCNLQTFISDDVCPFILKRFEDVTINVYGSYNLKQIAMLQVFGSLYKDCQFIYAKQEDLIGVR